MNKNIDKIIIPNVYEVVRRSMNWKTFPPDFQIKLRDSGNAYSELGLLWGGDNKIVVLPESVDDTHFNYIKELLNYQNIHIINTISKDGTLSKLTHELKQALVHKTQLILKGLFWGASKESYNLIDEINSNGIKMETNDIPQKEYFSIAEDFDSKIKFKDLLKDGGNNVNVMPSYVVSSFNLLITAIEEHKKLNRPCIIKSEFGISGYGNIVLGEKQLSLGLDKLIEKIDKIGESVPYFKYGRFIVEDLASSNNFSLTPLSCMAKIDSSGKCIINGIVKENRVLGLYNGAEIIGDKERLITNSTKKIGKLMAYMNYRGYFCADFLININGEVTLLELNTRRCSSHFIFELGERILQSNFVAKHYLSLPIVSIDRVKNNVNAVINILDNINKSNKEGVIIPTQLNGLTKPFPYIGFLIIGRYQKQLSSLQGQLLKKLEETGIILRGII